jgi:uncharacterized protein YcfJ
MVTDHVAVTAMMAGLVLHQFFHGRGNQVLAVETVMVLKYCAAIFLACRHWYVFYECQM